MKIFGTTQKVGRLPSSLSLKVSSFRASTIWLKKNWRKTRDIGLTTTPKPSDINITDGGRGRVVVVEAFRLISHEHVDLGLVES